MRLRSMPSVRNQMKMHSGGSAYDVLPATHDFHDVNMNQTAMRVVIAQADIVYGRDRPLPDPAAFPDIYSGGGLHCGVIGWPAMTAFVKAAESGRDALTVWSWSSPL
ncbi:hypothetical protein KOEU_21440 [Komagataeibacter europaeus]|uniref:Uncharacterized protein n=1 Tax=Komagataeibacter europaeus TaxID=33995 RepID=A0A0M0EHJ4_KOMEU|nr:hypothetical protein KOEU_21440 [Komagataeibacter europaeus]